MPWRLALGRVAQHPVCDARGVLLRPWLCAQSSRDWMRSGLSFELASSFPGHSPVLAADMRPCPPRARPSGVPIAGTRASSLLGAAALERNLHVRSEWAY